MRVTSDLYKIKNKYKHYYYYKYYNVLTLLTCRLIFRYEVLTCL